MILFHCVCETCGNSQFTPAGTVAYYRRDGRIHRIDLAADEHPWAGVRMVCPACLAFFRAAEPIPEPTSTRREGEATQ